MKSGCSELFCSSPYLRICIYIPTFYIRLYSGFIQLLKIMLPVRRHLQTKFKFLIGLNCFKSTESKCVVHNLRWLQTIFKKLVGQRVFGTKMCRLERRLYFGLSGLDEALNRILNHQHNQNVNRTLDDGCNKTFQFFQTLPLSQPLVKVDAFHQNCLIFLIRKKAELLVTSKKSVTSIFI